MEKQAPLRIKNIRKIIDELRQKLDVDYEVSCTLDEYAQRIYALEQDNKRIIAAVRAQAQLLADYEKRIMQLDHLIKVRLKDV